MASPTKDAEQELHTSLEKLSLNKGNAYVPPHKRRSVHTPKDDSSKAEQTPNRQTWVPPSLRSAEQALNNSVGSPPDVKKTEASADEPRYDFRSATKDKENLIIADRSDSSSPFIVRVPAPTEPYLQQSSQTPRQVDTARPILLVIDLNGTLLFRRNRKQPTNFEARPDLSPFVTYILQHFHVMVWSSAQPHNVATMCRRIFNSDTQRPKLLAEWARDRLGLTKEQYKEKVQVYKRLESVWDADEVQSKHPQAPEQQWDQSNTVLVDDSSLKATTQPHSVLELPEFLGKAQFESRVLKRVALYLDALRYQADISSYIREKPYTETAKDLDPAKVLDGFD